MKPRLPACVAATGLSLAVLLAGPNLAHAKQKRPLWKEADPTIVMTDKGPVRGAIRDGVREFKGIPYAAPPVGDLRWKLPQPPKPWKEPRDATRYASACPQVSRYGLTEASNDEDCLYLNVTVPYTGPADLKRKRPVIVWIHGGAFVGGASSLYPLDYMAKAGDAVVVSMNHRLGVFGFMPHPAFGRAHNGGAMASRTSVARCAG